MQRITFAHRHPLTAILASNRQADIASGGLFVRARLFQLQSSLAEVGRYNFGYLWQWQAHCGGQLRRVISLRGISS